MRIGYYGNYDLEVDVTVVKIQLILEKAKSFVFLELASKSDFQTL